ncbi:1417_t:CDS:2 [Ambispora leptoticha]|uniref:1417_t:CDS:1 n=1 Tax=Ambispora leptoticha TaxID=144679 RepID=A0A9N9BXG5_9GLOM|nr:1417_t:CDS:2 [Ambispora leptoticha]
MGGCCSRRIIEQDDNKFRYIDGRRYHNISDSEYMIPNDDEEAYRLMRYHEAIKDIWGGLFNSPIEEKLRQGARVIDIGCGTGTWILDMAKQYPKSHFIGVDLSPIFPSEGFPVNVNFIEYNLLDGLPFEDLHFDFVHQKFLISAFTESQWKEKVIPELIRITQADGWIELLEADSGFVSKMSTTKRICDAFKTVLTSKGINIKIGEILPSLLESTNAFSEVRYQKKSILLGKRGGQNGEETFKFVSSALKPTRGWLPAMIDIMPEHFDALLEIFTIEVEQNDTFLNQHRICGHKHNDNI